MFLDFADDWIANVYQITNATWFDIFSVWRKNHVHHSKSWRHATHHCHGCSHVSNDWEENTRDNLDRAKP